MFVRKHQFVLTLFALLVVMTLGAAQCAAPITVETVVETVVMQETVEVEKEVVVV